MTEPSDASDETAMRARLAALRRDLGAPGVAPPPSTPPAGPAGMGAALNMGVRVMSEFVAAVAVGGFIGWQLDHWLGSSPALLILFIALGTAAGFWQVYRVATKPVGR